MSDIPQEFDDPLLTTAMGNGADGPMWFDRAYFNLFNAPGFPAVVVGAAHYPNAGEGRGVSDGYAIVLSGESQRNLRFSQALGDPERIGPFHWQVVDPFREWTLELNSPETGVEMRARFTATTVPNFLDPIAANNESGGGTRFAHFFQRGRYEGELVVDGTTWSLDGWTGMRDRSRGLREARARLGMHLWGNFRTDDGSCLAFNYNETRDGSVSHLDGGLMTESVLGTRVTQVRHAFEVNEDRELISGVMVVTMEDGEEFDLGVEALSRGVFMAGGGYDGRHGVARGTVVEGETWSLDQSFDPASLGLMLVDKPCVVRCGGTEVSNIFEFALSRSTSYVYRTNL
ncbi:hypothetical protein ABLE68_04170 [Nocardioides sp. CN2-186]|uniref:hypothetical protein n=1 Tax=Nocardioides tweenelious TaxID=3156607 RepID=UPI0032B45120